MNQVWQPGRVGDPRWLCVPASQRVCPCHPGLEWLHVVAALLDHPDRHS